MENEENKMENEENGELEEEVNWKEAYEELAEKHEDYEKMVKRHAIAVIVLGILGIISLTAPIMEPKTFECKSCGFHTSYNREQQYLYCQVCGERREK